MASPAPLLMAQLPGVCPGNEAKLILRRRRVNSPGTPYFLDHKDTVPLMLAGLCQALPLHHGLRPLFAHPVDDTVFHIVKYSFKNSPFRPTPVRLEQEIHE